METFKFIRHSKSYYENYQVILNSESPDLPFDAANQIMPDLSDDGVELAKQEAKKLFSGMDKDHEALFFVSSDEARALSTAKIYKDIAKGQDFIVITPNNHTPEIIYIVSSITFGGVPLVVRTNDYNEEHSIQNLFKSLLFSK